MQVETTSKVKNLRFIPYVIAKAEQHKKGIDKQVFSAKI